MHVVHQERPVRQIVNKFLTVKVLELLDVLTSRPGGGQTRFIRLQIKQAISLMHTAQTPLNILHLL